MRPARLAAVILIGLLPLKAGADEAGDIRAVIGAQIAAFGTGDLVTAYGFASPDIQKIFPSPDIFGRMVATGYPMIWRPAEVVYFGLRKDGTRLLQRMGFRDGAGALHLFDYEMTPGETGWRIDGVIPVQGGETV